MLLSETKRGWKCWANKYYVRRQELTTKASFLSLFCPLLILSDVNWPSSLAATSSRLSLLDSPLLRLYYFFLEPFPRLGSVELSWKSAGENAIRRAAIAWFHRNNNPRLDFSFLPFPAKILRGKTTAAERCCWFDPHSHRGRFRWADNSVDKKARSLNRTLKLWNSQNWENNL